MTEPVENAYTNNECKSGCISLNKLNLLKSILDAVDGHRVNLIKANVEPIIAGLKKRVIKRVGTGNILQGQIKDKELLEFLQIDVTEETYYLPDNPENLKSTFLSRNEHMQKKLRLKAAFPIQDFSKEFIIETMIKELLPKVKRTKSQTDGKFIQDERTELKKNLEALKSLLVLQREYIEFPEFKTKKNDILRNLNTIITVLDDDIKKISDDKSDKTRNFNEFQKNIMNNIQH